MSDFQTFGIQATTLLDGRRFISDQTVVELNCRDFIDRFPNYWHRHESADGWVSPKELT